VAKFHYGGLPVHWLLGADFTLIDRLPQLSLPKLIIHGDKDDIIPLELGRQVFEAAKPPKSFYVRFFLEACLTCLRHKAKEVPPDARLQARQNLRRTRLSRA
jgi:fermentation-respiration switch protein FrsA (DUF1100 family)